MSYTGTGTEQDPYLVSTLTDFLTCAAVAGAYVKVISDINSADDPNYEGELTNPISIMCRKLYADQDKIISGITVTAAHFMESIRSSETASECDIVHLQFLHCTHNKTVTGSVSDRADMVFYTSNETAALNFDHSAFSMRLNCGIHSQWISEDETVTFNKCFMYIDINTEGDWYHLGLGYCTECNIHIKGAKYASNYVRHLANSSRCGLISEECVFQLISSTTSKTVLQNCHYVYIALVNPQRTDSLEASMVLQAYGNSSSCVIASDSSSVCGKSGGGTGFSSITLDQLKDRDYLLNIGFLP